MSALSRACEWLITPVSWYVYPRISTTQKSCLGGTTLSLAVAYFLTCSGLRIRRKTQNLSLWLRGDDAGVTVGGGDSDAWALITVVKSEFLFPEWMDNKIKQC